MMEPKHTRPEDSKTQVEASIAEDRLEGLLHPTSQPTSVEEAEDEPLFQCRGGELRLAKISTWMIAVTLVLAMWLVVLFIPFLLNLPLTSLIFVSILILGCAVVMALKKEKSWVKVCKDRIEWSSFSFERQILVRGLAETPYSIEIGAMFNRPAIKSLDGKILGKLPAIYGDNFLKLLAAAQKIQVPVLVNIAQPFKHTVNGQTFVNSSYFDTRRILAFVLPVTGAIVSFLIPRIGNLASSFTMLPFILCCIMSVILQAGLFAKRKDRTGLLFGENTITRIRKDEVIWSLSASDLRNLAFHANDFGIRAQAITQYGRRYDLGVSGLHALRFALTNNIPIVTQGKSAPEGDISNQ